MGLPATVPPVLLILAAAFITLGAIYLKQSTLRAREGEVEQFTAAVSKWDHFRKASFDHLSISVGIRIKGREAIEPAEMQHLIKVTDPDDIGDEEDSTSADALPQYHPLRYATNESFPDTLLPPTAFDNATSIQFVLDIIYSAKHPNTQSTITTAYFPTTTTRRVRAPQPAPETKCMVQEHGVLDRTSQECITYEALASVCLQVKIAAAGVVALAPMLPVRNRSSTPSYGCAASNAWSPVTYEPLVVDGHSTDDVVVPTVNLTALSLVVRSELDPYVHAQVITHDSMTFGLSSHSCLIVGATCMALGVLFALMTAVAVRRYCRDAMGDTGVRRTPSQAHYLYGQLEDAMDDNVLSPASSMGVYSISPPWRLQRDSSRDVEMFDLHRGNDDDYG